ncbi:MAG: TonB-dependent receptor [Alistipes sp.]|nr:TonB-dependent receptor [Alistipes sp.]
MKRLLVIISLLISFTAPAQEVADDYMRYKIDNRVYILEQIEPDTLLFYRVAQNRSDKFHSLTTYNLSFVDYSRRGIDYFESRNTIDGINLRYRNIPIIRQLGISEEYFGGLTNGNQGISGMAGTQEFSQLDGTPLDGGRVSLFFTGKGYLGGLRASLHSTMSHEWSLSAYLAARGGNDLYIDGVYNESIDAGVRLTKNFASGAIFSVLCVSGIGERGLRTGSTEEAFSLSGDNLYNPLWGRQDGRIRNSRVQREAVPFIVATYNTAISNTTTMTLSVGGDYGKRGTSSLGWYDAMTPRPDNYRYMPSYFTDFALSDAVAERWRVADERYTQINWNDLYRTNALSANGAAYTLDERVERIARGEMSWRMRSEFGQNLTLSYGLRGSVSSSRNYKRMLDMLGADEFVDLDYYLLDDDTYSNMLQNDLRHPDRHISQGDRFSYDYTITTANIAAEVEFEYRMDRWRIDADLMVGSDIIRRTGHYEKEIFAGNGSYGHSTTARFTPYTAKISASYLFSVQHFLDLHTMIATRSPYADDIFLNPQYNNRIAYDIATEKLFAAEANYRYTAPKVNVSLSAYFHSRNDARQMFRTYDDLSGEYCDVEVEGIGTMSYGIEAAAEIRIGRFLRAELAAAAERHIYSHNPLVTHYSDTTNEIISLHSESLMGDCVLGSPQIVGMASLTYLNYKGWAASCSVQAAALRYANADFIRRTERVLNQASMSEEIFQKFNHQQRLDDAVTMDISLSRWWTISKKRRMLRGGNPSRISATLSVRNLLGNKDIVRSSYEPSRIRNYTSGGKRIYLPQENIITYAYPRNIYAVVTWRS